MGDSDRVYATDAELLDALGAVVAEMLDVEVATMQRRSGGSVLAKGMPRSTDERPHARAALGKHVIAELGAWLGVERKTLTDWLGSNGGTVQKMWTRIGPVPQWTGDFRRLVVQAGRQLGDAAHPRHREAERIARIAEHAESTRRGQARRKAADGAPRNVDRDTVGETMGRMNPVNLNSLAEVVAGALGVSTDELRRPGSNRKDDPVRVGRRALAIASEGVAPALDVANWLHVGSTAAVLNLRNRARGDDSPLFRTALGAAQRVLHGTKPEPQVTA